MNRIPVKCTHRPQWGARLFSPSGAIYVVQNGGQLHVMLHGGVADPTPGVISILDAREFDSLPHFRVKPAILEQAEKEAAQAAALVQDAEEDEEVEEDAPPPAPPAPNKASKAAPPPPASGASVPAEADDAKLPVVVKLPDPQATKAEWTKWARDHGIALSKAQKGENKAKLLQIITDLATENGVISSEE